MIENYRVGDVSGSRFATYGDANMERSNARLDRTLERNAIRGRAEIRTAGQSRQENGGCSAVVRSRLGFAASHGTERQGEKGDAGDDGQGQPQRACVFAGPGSTAAKMQAALGGG